MRVRLTREPDGAICLESPYDRTLVDGLKQAIPWDGRKWEASRKRWIISPLYDDELHQFCQQHGITILDERCQTPPHAPALLAPPGMPEELRQAFDTLYCAYGAPLLVAEAAWKALSRVYHPDNQQYGDAEKSVALNQAMSVVRYYLGKE